MNPMEPFNKTRAIKFLLCILTIIKLNHCFIHKVVSLWLHCQSASMGSGDDATQLLVLLAPWLLIYCCCYSVPVPRVIIQKQHVIFSL